MTDCGLSQMWIRTRPYRRPTGWTLIAVFCGLSACSEPVLDGDAMLPSDKPSMDVQETQTASDASRMVEDISVDELCEKQSDCDDGDPCTEDVCSKTFGCIHVQECDDGNPCTADDYCVDGKCSGTALSDGSHCPFLFGCAANGKCVDGQCKVAFVDGAACDDGNDCTKGDVCMDGKCIGVMPPDACADDSKCTADACIDGKCHNGLGCDDLNECTIDTCAADGSCKHVASCDDNDPCTTEVCIQKKCVYSLTDCTDESGCRVGKCLVDQGCVFKPKCDNGDLCETAYCSDSHVCIVETKLCEDGDACTMDECQKGNCDHSKVMCDDGDPCTADACLKGFGCVGLPVETTACSVKQSTSCAKTGDAPYKWAYRLQIVPQTFPAALIWDQGAAQVAITSGDHSVVMAIAATGTIQGELHMQGRVTGLAHGGYGGGVGAGNRLFAFRYAKSITPMWRVRLPFSNDKRADVGAVPGGGIIVVSAHRASKEATVVQHAKQFRHFRAVRVSPEGGLMWQANIDHVFAGGEPHNLGHDIWYRAASEPTGNIVIAISNYHHWPMSIYNTGATFFMLTPKGAVAELSKTDAQVTAIARASGTLVFAGRHLHYPIAPDAYCERELRVQAGSKSTTLVYEHNDIALPVGLAKTATALTLLARMQPQLQIPEYPNYWVGRFDQELGSGAWTGLESAFGEAVVPKVDVDRGPRLAATSSENLVVALPVVRPNAGVATVVQTINEKGWPACVQHSCGGGSPCIANTCQFAWCSSKKGCMKSKQGTDATGSGPGICGCFW